MKALKTLLLLAVSCLMLSACGSMPIAQQSGKEDTSALLFVSQGQYAGTMVQVQLDDTQFEAKPVSVKRADTKGTAYSVAPGNRKIVVKNAKGEVIYSKKIFLSTQETKQIQLP